MKVGRWEVVGLEEETGGEKKTNDLVKHLTFCLQEN